MKEWIEFASFSKRIDILTTQSNAVENGYEVSDELLHREVASEARVSSPLQVLR
jgi:hypothetical protein